MILDTFPIPSTVRVRFSSLWQKGRVPRSTRQPAVCSPSIVPNSGVRLDLCRPPLSDARCCSAALTPPRLPQAIVAETTRRLLEAFRQATRVGHARNCLVIWGILAGRMAGRCSEILMTDEVAVALLYVCAGAACRVPVLPAASACLPTSRPARTATRGLVLTRRGRGLSVCQLTRVVSSQQRAPTGRSNCCHAVLVAGGGKICADWSQQETASSHGRSHRHLRPGETVLQPWPFRPILRSSGYNTEGRWQRESGARAAVCAVAWPLQGGGRVLCHVGARQHVSL